MSLPIFRVSSLGHACDRKLWLQSIQLAEEPRTLQSQLTMDIGTALEPVIMEYLELDGWTIDYNPGSQEADVELRHEADGCVIAGHYDCIAEKDDMIVMLDAKTMNSRAWAEWRKHGAEVKYPQYVTQVQLYAFMARKSINPNITYVGIAGLNKDRATFPIPVELLDYDELHALNAIARAERIAAMTALPPVDPNIPGWCCSYCGFKGTECDGLALNAHEEHDDLPRRGDRKGRE